LGLPQEDIVLDALGSPVRRTILSRLSPGPLPVGEIAAELPVSRPAVSQHLRILEQAGLVTHQKRGNRNLYRLDSGGFVSARAWLDSFWDTSLARFAMAAENTSPRRKRK